MITPLPPRVSPLFRRNLPNPRHRLLAGVAALVLVTMIHGPALAALHPHVRDGWILGLGIGGGSAALKSGGQTSDRETGSTGHLRAGYILNPKVSIGFEGNFWMKSVEGVDWTFDTYTAEATFYPGDGFTLRAGVGGGGAEAAVSSGSSTTTASETGLGVSTGVGYEIRVSRSWAVVPQADFSYINLDSFDANFFSFSVAAHWYILPK
jgi:outer membrane protein with beta-barrel domain